MKTDPQLKKPMSQMFCMHLVIALTLLTGVPLFAEPENSQVIADRYEQMLVRSPQAGTALDNVLSWYASGGGGLENLAKRWENAGAEKPEEAGRYLILRGLLAERMRSPGEARAFYQESMDKPGDPVSAAKLLAALETTEGRFKEAAEAYNQALKAGGLAPVLRMELLRSLALLYQRSFDDKKAGEIWKQAIAEYPDDPYVLEEAGEAFLDSGDFAGARDAFTKLQKLSERDPFRKVAATLRLARAFELEGNTDEAVRIYELALEETSPGSWINREVRGRIEELFRRKDDLPGLLAYYERRTAASPGDFEALASQAEVLQDLGKGSESLDRLRAATKLAPGETRLRIQLIRQLESQGLLPEAIAEARDLAKPTDASPDVIVLLGDLLWRAGDAPNRAEAMETWKRLAQADSKDPARIAQLAEIFAAKGEADAALSEWIRLVSVSPTASDARQKIARHHLEKGDKAAALASLAGLVEGDLATAENFLTLARIQSALEFEDESRATIASGREKFPSDSELLNFAWKQALESQREADVNALLPEVWAATENEFFAEDAIKRYTAFLETSGSSVKTREDLMKQSELSELQASVLMALAIANQNEEAATKALESLKAMASPVRSARAAANFAMTFGSPEEQVISQKAVADADPRLAVESLKTAAKILAESGKPDEALEIVSQLIDRSPADGSLYGFYADLASRTGRFEAASERLKDGVRYAGDPSVLRLQLATFLQMQGRNAEAAKALQDAFEAEERQGKRSEIFRRQIEMAMQNGTLDDLTAAIRAKQSREEGGSRYGAYLAEIFILQDDYLSAREELAKTLGRNPDDPAAVSKLLDLAERGGDQEEALRLATRLAEIQPSNENRADLIQRLFKNSESERGLAEFQKAREDILKDPSSWGEALMALRQAGFTKESDELISELAAAKSSDPLILTEIVNLYLANLDFEKAEQILWSMVNSPEFPAAMEAITTQPPLNQAMYFGAPPGWARLQSLQMLSNEVQNSVQMMFQPNRGGYGNRMRFHYGGMMPQNSGQATPQQRALVKSALLLMQLSRARGTDEDFAKKLDQMFEGSSLTTSSEFILRNLMGDQEGLLKLLAEQAAKTDADIETDRLFLTAQFASPQNENPDLKTIQERVEKSDPAYGFQRDIGKLMEIRTAKETTPEEKRKALKEAMGKLMTHPGAAESPMLKLQLVSLAMEVEEFQMAREILAQVKEAADSKKPGGMNAMFLENQIMQMEVMLLSKAILADEEGSAEEFLQTLKSSSSKTGMAGMPFLGRHYRSGRMPSMLAQETPELAVGDPDFPVMTFQALFPPSSPNAEKGRAWFTKRVTPGTWDPFFLGVVYSDWFAGKKTEAIAAVEKFHEAAPSPRSAALLLEMYERTKATDKALAVIDLAELQKTETPDIRTLRKIRLLRAAGKIPEAKDMAQKLVRNRLSQEVRENLRGQLESLGIPSNQIPQFSNMRSSRSRRDPGDQIREQISKLVADKKTEEAERMAFQILQGALPARDDYQTTNLRRNMVNSLKSMNSLNAFAETLEARLTEDPGDFDAVLRLMELEIFDEGSKSGERLLKHMEEYPDRIGNLAYALRLLQNRSESKSLATKILCQTIRKDPDLLFKSGFSIEETANLTSDPADSLLLAETLAAIDDASFKKLFLPNRLTGMSSNSPLITQLAESSVQAGKVDPAIQLLKRGLPMSLEDLNSGFATVMRLAELQLQNGDKEGAAATMRQMLNSNPSHSRMGIMGGRQTISNILMNLMMNRMPGQLQENQLTRLSDIAAETGTLDEFLKLLEEQSPQVKGVSPALLIKTSLGRPGIAAEWRVVINDDSIPLGFFNLPMMAPVLKALAKEKDAAKLIPKLLGRIPDQNYQSGGDQSLTLLSESLPALLPYRKDPAVKKHLELLISRSMQDPNASQYLPHYASYTQAISVLIANGYLKEARALLDFTAATRKGRNYGNAPVFAAFESRLDAAEGKKTNYQIVCATGAEKEGKTQIHWKLSADLSDAIERGSRQGIPWDPVTLPVPEKFRPTAVEIFAGENPAVMKSVAKVSKPGLSGVIGATLPGSLGLLQARWTLPDGTKSWGRLSAYVQGENLIPNKGLPEGKLPPGFQIDLDGPLGAKSAVGYEGMVPRTEFQVPLATIPIDETPAFYVISGWLQASGSNGQLPEIKLEIQRTGNSKQTDSIYSSQAAAGQWVQTFKIWNRKTNKRRANSLSEDATSLSVSLGLRASNGFNSLWQMESAWDGMGLYKIFVPESTPKVDDIVSGARKAVSSGDYAKGCADYLLALEIDPAQLLNQSASNLWEPFEKAGKLEELYTALSEPALYLPDPLNDHQPAVNSEDLLNLLIRGALAKNPPAAASKWLRMVADAPLRDNQRTMVESAILREEAAKDPSAAPPDKVLKVLGFSKEDVEEERVRQLFGNSSIPAFDLLALLDTPDKRATTRDLLAAVTVPTSMLTAQQTVQAWLLAPDEPAEALKIWSESIGFRNAGENSVSFSREADNILFARIAMFHPQPGDVVAALNGWTAAMRSSPEYQKQMISESLYAISKSESPQREFYATAWADNELAGLKIPNFNAQRERVRELANQLMQSGDWDRLASLLELAKTNNNLKSSSFQREFDQLRDLVAIAKGDLSKAWPVAWTSGDGNSTKVFWQWNSMDIQPKAGKFDTAVSVSAKPPVEKIAGQSRMEILFGETPSELAVIASAEGDASSGQLVTKLPKANGFLRAVALVKDQRFPGPLVPVISGKRIFPSADQSLTDLLISGTKPIEKALISEAGSAPDGTPALRIGKSGTNNRLGYEGPEFPVEPGKFYVLRSWIKRVGDGSASLGGEFLAAKTSNARPLNMILSEREEATSQWVLYTRALSATPQHTFWIPFREVGTIRPRFSDLTPGTEIAAWELYEVSDWEYANWLAPLTMLRESVMEAAKASPDAATFVADPATMDKFIALTAFEPLTALDFHGSWLVTELTKAGRPEVLLPLYKQALAATEPNPLFSRPKLDRIFGSLINLAGDANVAEPVRAEAYDVALASSDRLSVNRRLEVQRGFLELAKSRGVGEAATQKVAADIQARLAEPESQFLSAVFGNTTHRDDKPVMEIIGLLDVAASESLNKTLLADLNEKNSLEPGRVEFLKLLLELTTPGTQVDKSWIARIDAAFEKSRKSGSPVFYMFGPSLLADWLVTKKADPAVVLHLHTKSLERILAEESKSSSRQEELFRAATRLAENVQYTGGSDTLKERMPAIVEALAAHKDRVSETSMRLALRLIEALNASGDSESTAAILKIVEKDVRKNPRQLEAYGKYIKP
jgi:predicted Zn-dependent protease